MKFKRQDYFKYKKLGDKWRRPRGRQSKMRKCKGGAGKMPKIGYRTKKEERGKIKINGKLLNPVIVTSIKIAEQLGKNDVGIISSTMGLKKIKEIHKIAKEKGVMILNKKRFKALMKRTTKIEKKKIKEKEKPKKEKGKATPTTEGEIKEHTNKQEEKTPHSDKSEAKKNPPSISGSMNSPKGEKK